MSKNTYFINGVPVYVRNLPSGDISVWHPYNDTLAQIIYPICHGRGYWNPKHNNWIVFKQFSASVCEELHNRS